ncbi:branched-chain amino acid ABC transporter permease [Bradyrhizobium tunisiense]|uniref:branched-chain amino acid ABC transporter permease n=1 Tax=Bradyrhizobium tunisiense TaxID=3278709 RepID=UPI0035E1C190
MLLLQLIINGIQVGALYGLTAVGFSLIFGATKIFHFAHGASFAISAYVFYYLYVVLLVWWPIAILAACIVVVVFGVALDRYVYGPIQSTDGSFFTIFVGSFGVAVVIQNLLGTIFGRGFISVPSVLSRSIELVPGLYVAPTAGIAVVTALACFVALQFFLGRTNIGIALRALSESPALVRTFGLNPRAVSTCAFALGSLLVVPAAVITSMTSGLNAAIGGRVMLLSVAATIVGGVGSLRGAACAGLLLGIAENLALWRFDPQWSEAVTFLILFAFIVLRPAGFFGRAVTS